MKRAGLLLLTALWTTTAASQDFFDQFIDPGDGWLDMSQWLIDNAYGFLPVPVIITEPAIGTGLGLAGVYFHKPGDDARPRKDGGFPVTDISAAVGAYTSNESWLGGGYHFNTMRQDTMRYTGFAGYGDINLEYYGTTSAELPNGIKFDVEGFITGHEFLFRSGESDWFIGPSWDYQTTDSRFELPIPGFQPIGIDATVSGPGAVLLYEKTDSQFSPTRGATMRLQASFNRDAFGSDFKYDQYEAELRSYFRFREKFTLGLRFDATATNGDVPFYLEPYITLQGIPAVRYQGPVAATAEIRGGWQFHPRFTAMAFTGGGRAADTIGGLGSATTRGSVGVGFRYDAARRLGGLKIGIDVARGPEDTHYYLVTGSAW